MAKYSLHHLRRLGSAGQYGKRAGQGQGKPAGASGVKARSATLGPRRPPSPSPAAGDVVREREMTDPVILLECGAVLASFLSASPAMGFRGRRTREPPWGFPSLSTHGHKFDDVFIGRTGPGPPGRPETPRHTHPSDGYPASPSPGAEGAVLWRPTRGKGEPASTRRQASEGRSGGPAIRHRNYGQHHSGDRWYQVPIHASQGVRSLPLSSSIACTGRRAATCQSGPGTPGSAAGSR